MGEKGERLGVAVQVRCTCNDSDVCPDCQLRCPMMSSAFKLYFAKTSFIVLELTFCPVQFSKRMIGGAWCRRRRKT
jgi:hypothetical protein